MIIEYFDPITDSDYPPEPPFLGVLVVVLGTVALLWWAYSW